MALTTAATSLCAGDFAGQGEAGYLYAAREGGIQYELIGGYRVTDDIAVSAIVVDSVTKRNSPELAVGTLRWGSPGLALDIGRPGVSLGLTPPVYSGRRPSASRPSVDSAVALTALAAYGVPDYGIGLVGSTYAGLGYSAHAYTLQKQTVKTVALLALQSGALTAPFNNARPQAPDGCTFCAVAVNASAAAVDLSVFVAGAQRAGFIPPNATPDTRVEFSEYGGHAGLYYADDDVRWAVDVTAFDALGGTYVFTPAVEFSSEYGDAGIQAFALASRNGGTVGAHGWAVSELSDAMTLYARVGFFDGKSNASEFAFGSIHRVGRINFKAGIEYLDLDTAAGGGHDVYPVLAVGVSI